MRRDLLKTIAGLIIIGVIVVATFLYGNSQRQAQLSHDQQIKKQQEAKAQAQAKAAAPSVAPTAPVATGNATSTGPVKSPAASTVQGSATATPGAVAGAAVSTQTPAVTPAAGGSDLPAAGPEMAGIVGVGSISVMVFAVRRSRRAMIAAARRHR